MNEISKHAETLAMIESTFEERINSNKALRGEKPTSAARKKKTEIDQYKQDADDATDQLAKDFMLMEKAEDIIWAILSGLDGDVAFWKSAVENAHPADMPIVDEFLSAKIQLRDSLAAYVNNGSGK